MFIKSLNEVSSKDLAEVGGKGASLGEMLGAGIPVPPGFVVTTEAYREFCVGMCNNIPPDFGEMLLGAFDSLGAERVAVRSSAIAEDSPSASWAGQLETCLNIKRETLLNSILHCWHSVKSERALNYAAKQNIREDQLAVAVVVQAMVDSQTAGVIFTVNPVSLDKNEMMIESVYGLGEMLVQGTVTPNNFVVDKMTLEIRSSFTPPQDKRLFYDGSDTVEAVVPPEESKRPNLSKEQLAELSQLANKIEEHYGIPQDIEWALAGDKLYILQSRPITTL
jgi:pyruvate,water dikinase